VRPNLSDSARRRPRTVPAKRIRAAAAPDRRPTHVRATMPRRWPQAWRHEGRRDRGEPHSSGTAGAG